MTMKKCGRCGEVIEDWVRFHYFEPFDEPAGGHYVDVDDEASDVSRNLLEPSKPVEEPALEDTIQLEVRTALQYLGYHVSDLSQDRPTRQTAGIPDLFVMGHGKSTWMEVKRPKLGRVSKDQKEWHRIAQENGVPMRIVTSVGDALAWHEDGS